MSTLPKTQAPAYTDLAGLSKLRRGAGNNDPAAIRAVAEQFEALLTRTLLKSMREASGPDPMFGSDQQQMYQGMADDQLSIQLAKGKGLGLADMLIRQLQKLGVKGADAAQGASAPAAAHGTGNPAASNAAGGIGAIRGGKAASAYSSTQRASDISDADRANFVQDLWPHAQQAAQSLGVDPRNLIAQAALETHWGRSLPQDSSGRCSNNLFGMKVSGDWSGAAVTSSTQEFVGAALNRTAAQFKAYDSPAQSFQDYVALLRNNPRYAAVLNTGSDIHAFANGLQRGGYATDPNYANKIVAIAGSLKVAAAPPVSAAAGAL